MKIGSVKITVPFSTITLAGTTTNIQGNAQTVLVTDVANLVVRFS